VAELVLALVPFLISYACGSHLSARRGAAAVTMLAILLQVALGFEDFPDAEILLLTLVPWWVGGQVQVRRRLVRELTRRTNELEAEQDAFAVLSVQRERARIARELHDIVAHHMALIVVQAGAGRLTAAAAGASVARLRSIRDSGGQALAEMARLVDIIHADAGSSDAAGDKLRALFEQARAGGLALDVEPLPDDIADQAVGIVREALTNAMKHAPGARVTVRLSDTEVEVRSSGGGPPSGLAETGSGMGLAGMRDRIESLGGTFAAGPFEGGWRVYARLPALAAALSAP